MEPIKRTLTARLGILRMYREELDELVGMFQRTCEKVTISDSKYRYDTLDEMKGSVPKVIKELEIHGENPGVRFLFNQVETIKGNPPTVTVFTELRTEETSDAAEALFFKVREFLVTHQQRTTRPGLVILAIVAVVGLFWFAWHNHGIDSQGNATIGSLPGFLTSFVVFGLCLSFGLGVKNYLTLETKRNSESFFVRNREEFAKHAVTATISGVIGGVIGYFLGHFLK
jgi:hypothetical protein